MLHIQRIIAFIIVMAMPSLAQAAVFWDDEMENSSTRFNTSGYLIGTLIPGLIMAFDTSVKFSGTGSIRLNYPVECQTLTIVGQCGGGASAPIPPTDDLWQRLYFRMSGTGPNPTPSGIFIPSIVAATKMMKTQNGTTYPRTWFIMGINSPTFGVGLEHVPSVGHTRVNAASIRFVSDRWYCIETHQRMNTAAGGVFLPDGVVQAYVDNVLVLNITDALLRNSTLSPTAQWTEVAIFRQIGQGNIWYDKWATGSARIGCIGTTPPVDTTRPTPPTNLTAQ